MAIYNSTHTGQEIDNAVDKLNSIKLFRYDVNFEFVGLDTNSYATSFCFYSSNENIGNNITDLMNGIFGTENITKTYNNMFIIKDTILDTYYQCAGISKIYDNVLLQTYYQIIKADGSGYVKIDRIINNISMTKTKIM